MSELTSSQVLELPKPNYRVTALIIASALFMEQLDSTVLATALPTMARYFDVSPSHMSIALTSYLLSLAVLIPASGHIADRFGARTVFASAIVVFTLSSILCAQAHDASHAGRRAAVAGRRRGDDDPGRPPRVAAQRRQGRSRLGDGLAPGARPDRSDPRAADRRPDRHLSRLALDLLHQRSDRRSRRRADAGVHPEHARDDAPAVRSWGFALSGVSLACLLFGFETTSRGVGETSVALALIGAGFVSGLAYVVYARRARRVTPILDLSLMRIKTFRVSMVAGSLSRITQGAQPFLLPLMMQLAFGMSAARERPADLRHRLRLHDDEGDRGADTAALRLSHAL